MKSSERRSDFLVRGDPNEHVRPKWVHSFVLQWRDNLENPESDEDSFWEANSAVHELKKRNYHSLLMSFSADKPRMFLQIIREIEIYKGLYSCVVSVNQDFGRLKRILELCDRKLQNFKSKTKGPAGVGKDLSAQIRDILERIPKAEEEFWRDAVEFTESELEHPFFARDALERDELTPQYMLPEWAGQVEYNAYHWKIPQVVTKRANLDTRLQIRLAVIVRLYLPTLTWRTIARLVTLAYICANLAIVRHGRLFVSGSKSELQVVKVEKKIYNARPVAESDPDSYFS